MQIGVRTWVATAFAIVSACSFVFGALALFGWSVDGMDPGTQFSARVWKMPLVLGVIALSPTIVMLIWLYVRWCIRATRTFLTPPNPLTIDHGW